MRRLLLMATLGHFAMGGVAHAQARQTFRISINGGLQVAPQTVHQQFSLPLYVEQAHIVNDVTQPAAAFFDIGGHYHVAGELWAGVSFTSSSATADGEVSADLPHPFLFNQFRTADGVVDNLASRQTGVHISLGYLKPLGDKFELLIFGGPSRFGITQELITDVKFDEQYPFDTAAMTSATQVDASASTWGFNVGADISYWLSQKFRVGGLLRITRASATLDAAPGNTVSFDGGGVQAGGGIRLLF